MNKHDIEFQIDQLRKDKIIYATEATATSTTAIVVLVIFSDYFRHISSLVGYFVLGYWLYAMIGNFFRLRKIKQLEAQL